MTSFGLFQGFGQMSRGDFRAPARSPRPAARPAANPYGGTRGNGNTNPYGTAGNRGLPAGYAYQERLMSRRADNSRVVPTGQSMFGPMKASDFGRGPAPVAAPSRTLASAPSRERPAAVTVGRETIEADYRVRAGQAPMPPVPQRPPAGSTASRGNAVMAPLGASRNEALVQAAGNAGMRLADPAAFKMFAGNGVMPATSEDTSRRMLSEFGSGRPALAPAAAFDTSSEIASAAISPRALATAEAAFAPVNTGGDRFSHLRPDLATWARANQNAAKGLDGLNIVDRFMAKQGAAPPAAPASFAEGLSVDPAHAYRASGGLPTAGANVGLSAEAQTQISGAFERPLPVDPAAAFGPGASALDQVQALREAYRNNSRPNPGITAPTSWNY